jgi:hypothetical protein
MYHAPLGERTEAWNPSGPMSARIVAARSSMPAPEKVMMFGCLRASAGSITGESSSAKR